jgi:transcriptional regulator with XRE-family HTH domain
MVTRSQQRPEGVDPPTEQVSGTGKQRWGTVLRDLRERYHLTRTGLIQACWRVVTNPEQAALMEKVPSETQLSRIERGVAKKVDREQLELLFRAIDCSADERMHVLMLAGCTTITVGDTEQPPEGAQLINQIAELLYNVANLRTALVDLMRHTRATSRVPISEGEMLAMLWSVLDLEIQRRKGSESEEARLYHQAIASIGEIPGARERIVTTMRRRKTRDSGAVASYDMWDMLFRELSTVVTNPVSSARQQRRAGVVQGD